MSTKINKYMCISANIFFLFVFIYIIFHLKRSQRYKLLAQFVLSVSWPLLRTIRELNRIFNKKARNELNSTDLNKFNICVNLFQPVNNKRISYKLFSRRFPERLCMQRRYIKPTHVKRMYGCMYHCNIPTYIQPSDNIKFPI